MLKFLKKLVKFRPPRKKTAAYLEIDLRGRVIVLPNGKRIRAKEILPINNELVLVRDIFGREHLVRLNTH